MEAVKEVVLLLMRFFCESSCFEVANVVVNGSQSKVYEREANLESVPVSVEAGFIIGTHSDEERNPSERLKCGA